ncbi:MAG: monofunctional biosynthetic peptidoglycan transglycosylase [Gemmatimonadota bacterium]
MRLLAKGLLFVAVAAAALVAASILMYFPAVLWHRYRAPESTSVMHYRAAEARAAGETWEPSYRWVPIEEISPNLEAAVLAGEDSRFYEHHGFDMQQIQAAWDRHERGGRLRGASTITQQTVKNLYLTPRRSFLRKLREAVLTAWMELWLPKRRILELYLNIVELGRGVFGAEAAARTYFDRPAAALTPSQAALLAATLPAPLVRNPARPTSGLRRLQGMILGRMERWYGRRGRPGEAPEARPGEPERRPSEPLDLRETAATGATVDTAAPAEPEAPLPEELPADTLPGNRLPGIEPLPAESVETATGGSS